MIYVLICTTLYFLQESLIFHPTKLSKDYNFRFRGDFKEINVKSLDGETLNMLKFPSNLNKGVVLFFHGNGGNIAGWGNGFSLYTNNGFDVIYWDYRGYGKSDGKIRNEKQLLSDAQLIYDYLKKDYRESDIIVSGTSLGTGISTYISGKNNPKKLVLNSPYSSMKSLILEKMPFIPNMLIKYKLESDKYLEDVKCPIHMFHGQRDDLIPYAHSLKLKEKYLEIELIPLENSGHNDIFESRKYKERMREILN